MDAFNFTDNMTKIMNIVKATVKTSEFEPVHLLTACCMVPECLACQYLKSEDITAEKIKNEKQKFFPDKTIYKILEMADEQSKIFDQPSVVSEALLFVLAAKCSQTRNTLDAINPGSAKRLADKILSGEGFNPQKSAPSPNDTDDTNDINKIKINTVQWITTDPKTAYKNPKFTVGGNIGNDGGDGGAADVNSTVLREEILRYGQDLTAKAREGKIDNIIGREEETARMLEILCRKTKNNPVLIGEAGVGKSAIVEGLAQKIVGNDVPDLLKNKIVFSLDIGLLLAGAKYRGELEGRINVVLTELSKREDVILFIDEIHNIVTSSNKDSEMGLGEILKPKLARGEIRCVGATTIEEYRKYIEKDPALERRFAPIMVYPPTPEQAIQIVAGLCEGFEKFHKVEIKNEAAVASVALTDRYIFDRNLPDKAIDVLDEACAKAKIKNSGSTTKPVITAEDIAAVVSGITKIPLNKITAKDKENLLSLEDELRKNIVGQEKAISLIAKAIRRARSGIADRNKPTGSFFFLGRTGVGKTEVCKQLATVLFDTEKAFLKFDMSEYQEAHSVSKLIGAPAGYVGYDDASVLCDKVKRNPYCLVLFDEIEKAHTDIYNILLQILDEGRLTDSHGHTVSFKNAIIVMTSNVGVSNIVKKNAIGFGAEENQKDEEDTILAGMKKKFPPEFLNRIDNIVVFNSLTESDVKKVAGIHLDKLVKKLASVGVNMEYSPAVIGFIASAGYDAEYGIRPLKRVIQTEIEDKISELIITGEIKSVAVTVENGKIVCR
jgi:ATP-dependent Clp protease ATP-binding subunit ClpC